jgi:16S rRNA G966 N2-methylase RsmD
MNRIFFGDNLPILQSFPSESIDLIYIDPPFNTGKVQKLTQVKTLQSEDGDRVGFQLTCSLKEKKWKKLDLNYKLTIIEF